MAKFALIILAFISTIYPGVSQESFMEMYLEKWSNSKDLMLEYAELMPEEQYDFKPTEEEMSFKRLVIHIMQNMLWISTDYLDASPFKNDIRKADPSKEELIAILQNGFSHVEKTLKAVKPHRLREKVDFFAGEKNILQMLELLDDHMTHHRGQLSVYLRLNGIKPPQYKGW